MFSTTKMWLGAILFAAIGTGWLVDRHAQFEKGVAQCQQQHAEADTKEIERQKQDNEKYAKEAEKVSSQVSEQVASIKIEKPHEVAKTKELAAKAATPPSCDLNADELRDFNEAIRKSNE